MKFEVQQVGTLDINFAITKLSQFIFRIIGISNIFFLFLLRVPQGPMLFYKFTGSENLKQLSDSYLALDI